MPTEEPKPEPKGDTVKMPQYTGYTGPDILPDYRRGLLLYPEILGKNTQEKTE